MTEKKIHQGRVAGRFLGELQPGIKYQQKLMKV